MNPADYNWMPDTDSKAFEVLVDLQRKMSGFEKLECALRNAAMWMSAAEESVRRLYPNASDREVFLRAAARRLDRETMIRAYGWDPLEAEK